MHSTDPSLQLFPLAVWLWKINEEQIGTKENTPFFTLILIMTSEQFSAQVGLLFIK